MDGWGGGGGGGGQLQNVKIASAKPFHLPLKHRKTFHDPPSGWQKHSNPRYNYVQ